MSTALLPGENIVNSVDSYPPQCQCAANRSLVDITAAMEYEHIQNRRHFKQFLPDFLFLLSISSLLSVDDP